MTKTDGIVLKKYEVGEDGILIHVLTRDFGKLKLVDHNLRRKEHYGGKVDLFSHIEFFFNNNPDYEINFLLGVESIEKYGSRFQSLNTIHILSFFMESLSELLGLRMVQKDVYPLVLKFLSDCPGEVGAVKERTCLFLATILTVLGHKPPRDYSRPETPKNLSELMDFVEQVIERPLKTKVWLAS